MTQTTPPQRPDAILTQGADASDLLARAEYRDIGVAGNPAGATGANWH